MNTAKENIDLLFQFHNAADGTEDSGIVTKDGQAQGIYRIGGTTIVIQFEKADDKVDFSSTNRNMIVEICGEINKRAEENSNIPPITVEEWNNLTPEEREFRYNQAGLTNAGHMEQLRWAYLDTTTGAVIDSEDVKDGMIPVLTGTMFTRPDMLPVSAWHEISHAFISFLQETANKVDERENATPTQVEDANKDRFKREARDLFEALQSHFGIRKDGDVLVEEALANALRDYVNGKVDIYTPAQRGALDKIYNFLSTLRRLAGFADRKAEQMSLAIENPKTWTEQFINAVVTGDLSIDEALKRETEEATRRARQEEEANAGKQPTANPVEPGTDPSTLTGVNLPPAETDAPTPAAGTQPAPAGADPSADAPAAASAETAAPAPVATPAVPAEAPPAPPAQIEVPVPGSVPAKRAPSRQRLIATPDNSMTVTVTPMFVKASDVISSDMANYPHEMQPRDRNTAASRRQIEEIARDLNPDIVLNNSATSDTGAPKLAPSGAVLSGNGRVMSIRRAHEIGNGAAYDAAVQARAQEYGITLPALQNGDFWIYCDEVSGLTHDEMVRFTELSNRSSILQRSLYELAIADGKAILADPEIMGMFSEIKNPGDVDFSSAQYNDVIGRFVFLTGDRGLEDSRGHVVSAAYDRMSNGLVAALALSLDEEGRARDVIRAIIERDSTGQASGMKQVLKGVQLGAPFLLQLDMTLEGKHGRSITKAVALALADFIQLKKQVKNGKAKYTLADIAALPMSAQAPGLGIIDDLPAEAEWLVREFAGRASNHKSISAMLERYANLAKLNAPETDLFGTPASSNLDLLKKASADTGYLSESSLDQTADGGNPAGEQGAGLQAAEGRGSFIQDPAVLDPQFLSDLAAGRIAPARDALRRAAFLAGYPNRGAHMKRLSGGPRGYSRIIRTNRVGGSATLEEGVAALNHLLAKYDSPELRAAFATAEKPTLSTESEPEALRRWLDSADAKAPLDLEPFFVEAYSVLNAITPAEALEESGVYLLNPMSVHNVAGENYADVLRKVQESGIPSFEMRFDEGVSAIYVTDSVRVTASSSLSVVDDSGTPVPLSVRFPYAADPFADQNLARSVAEVEARTAAGQVDADGEIRARKLDVPMKVEAQRMADVAAEGESAAEAEAILELTRQGRQNSLILEDILKDAERRIDGAAAIQRPLDSDGYAVKPRTQIREDARNNGGDYSLVPGVVSGVIELPGTGTYSDALSKLDESAMRHGAFIARVEKNVSSEWLPGVRGIGTTLRFQNGGLGEVLLTGKVQGQDAAAGIALNGSADRARYSFTSNSVGDIFQYVEDAADIPVSRLRAMGDVPLKDIRNAVSELEKIRDSGEKLPPLDVVSTRDGNFSVLNGSAVAHALSMTGSNMARVRVLGPDRGTRLENSAYLVEDSGVYDEHGKKITLKVDGLEGLSVEEALDLSYQKAAENRSDLARLVEKAGAESGAVKTVMRKTLKGRERAQQKAYVDYNGDASRVVDLDGGTIVYGDDGDFAEGINEIKKNLPAGASVVKVKKVGYDNKEPGYRDVKVSIRFANGGIGEIILISDYINTAKFERGGHVVYEAERILEPAAKNDKEALTIWNDVRKLTQSIYSRGDSAPDADIFESIKSKASSSLTRLCGKDNASISAADMRVVKSLVDGFHLAKHPSTDSYAKPPLSLIQKDMVNSFLNADASIASAQELIAKYTEEGNGKISEPGDESASAFFPNSYKTREGKAVRYKSEKPGAYGTVSEGLLTQGIVQPSLFDFNAGGTSIGAQNAPSTPAEAGAGTDAEALRREAASALTETRGDKLNKGDGEFCLVERVFAEKGGFNFMAGEKIESADDVAFIFSELESAACEHTFIVLVKNGQPTVVEISMGGFDSASVFLPPMRLAVDRIQPDEMYFVHNHPGGSLECSAADSNSLTSIRERVSCPVHGIIINLKTGKYARFGENVKNLMANSVSNKRTPKNALPLKIYSLDKQIFSPNFDPGTLFYANSPDLIASFVNSHRMGDRAKISLLVLNLHKQIVANVHSPFTSVTSANKTEVAKFIFDNTVQFGGTLSILYGDFPITGDNGENYGRLRDLSGGTLVDVMRIEGNHYKSAFLRNLMTRNSFVSKEPNVDFDRAAIRYSITSQLDRLYPGWSEGTVTDSGKHTTQIAGTRKTYGKLGDWIEKHLDKKKVEILDASSGMGYGTADLRKRGFNIEDVEPFQSDERLKKNPATYSNYSDIRKEYDFIVSNAVLNVVPDDVRSTLLQSMALMLKPGGRLFINTRRAGEEKDIKDKIELDSPQEVLVKRNGRVASYQRFFTPNELRDWVQDELGPGYTVEVADKENSGTSGLAAVMVQRNDAAAKVAEPVFALPAESRFSVTNPSPGNLFIGHNISQENLMKTLLDLPTGFPMPSLAITTVELGLEGHGDVTVLFSPETGDPENQSNYIYSSDAWTPEFKDAIRRALLNKALWPQIRGMFDSSSPYRNLDVFLNSLSDYDNDPVRAFSANDVFHNAFIRSYGSRDVKGVFEKEFPGLITGIGIRLDKGKDLLYQLKGKVETRDFRYVEFSPEAVASGMHQFAHNNGETLTISAQYRLRTRKEFYDLKKFLRREDYAAHQAAIKAINRRYDFLSRRLDEQNGIMTGFTHRIILDVIKNNPTKDEMIDGVRSTISMFSDADASVLWKLIKEARQLARLYLEGKPHRVVPFSEIAAFIVPIGVNPVLLSKIKEKGFSEKDIYYYNPSVSGSRRETIAQASLSNNARMSFISSIGASALDAFNNSTERMDNLARAKEALAIGYPMKKIKLMFGWELGVDKKWRYEIDDSQMVFSTDGKFAFPGLFQEQFELLDLINRVYSEDNPRPIEEQNRLDDLVNRRVTYNDEFSKALKEFYEKIRSEGVPLKEFLKHDELFKAYPEIENIKVRLANTGRAAGVYDRKTNTITLNSSVPTERMMQALIHEIQHSIQKIEGLARGGNIGQFLNDEYYSKLKLFKGERKPFEGEKGTNDASLRKYLERNFTRAHHQYKRLAGEVEARNTASRMNMSMEERRNSLAEETMDVNPEDQIVKFDDSNLIQALKDVSEEDRKIIEDGLKAPARALDMAQNTRFSITDKETEAETALKKAAEAADLFIKYKTDDLKKSVSAAFQNPVMEKIPLERIMEIPILDTAAKQAEEFSKEPTYNKPGREEMRAQWARKLSTMGSYSGNGQYNGEVKNEHIAFIIIGQSSAGKSTIADPISQKYNARIYDSDVIKTMIPEFNGGLGSGAVHWESDVVMRNALDGARKQGVNIVLPIVGSQAYRVERFIQDFRQNNYTVYLILNRLDSKKAALRGIVRFIFTGRFVDPLYINGQANGPETTYESIKHDKLADGYQAFDNDVPYGEKPRLLDEYFEPETEWRGFGEPAGGELVRENRAASGRRLGQVVRRERAGVSGGDAGESSEGIQGAESGSIAPEAESGGGNPAAEHMVDDVSDCIRNSFVSTGYSYSPKEYVAAIIARDRIKGITPDEKRYQKLLDVFHLQDRGVSLSDVKEIADGIVSKYRKDVHDTLDVTVEQLANTAGGLTLDQATNNFVRKLGKSYMDIGTKAERAWNRALSEWIRAERGRDYQDLVDETAVDLSELLMQIPIERAQRKPKKQQQQADKQTAKSGEEIPDAEAPKGEDAEPAPGQQDENVRVRAQELADEVLARRERILKILRDWRAKEAERKIKLAQLRDERSRNGADAAQDAAQDEAYDKGEDSSGSGGMTEDEKARETPDYQSFIESLKAEGIDIRNIAEMSAFLQIWVEDFCGGSVSSRDPERFAKYRRTMRQVLRHTADSLIDGGTDRGAAAIRSIERAIGDLELAATVGEVQKFVRSVLRRIQAETERFSRAELIAAIRKNVRTLAIRGKKFDELEKDLKRKVSGSQEKRARYVWRILDWGEARIEREKQRLWGIISGRQQAYAEAGQDDSMDTLAETDKEFYEATGKLQLLERWGGLKRKSLSQIKAEGRAIFQWLETESKRHDEIWTKWSQRNDALADLVQKLVQTKREFTPAATFGVGLTDHMISTVRQRLEYMFAGSGKDAENLINELMYIISSGSEQLAVLKKRFSDEHTQMLEESVKGTNKTVATLLKELTETVPAELNRQLISKQQKIEMTWGQVLQLYASLCQTASYADNIALHGRQGQRAMIERYLKERPELLKLVEGMRALYAARRAELSAMMEQTCGMPMLTPDPLYMPVKMFRGANEGMEARVSVWNPFGKWASPRVRNNLDFDLSADIADLFADRARESARSLAFGVRGMQLRSILMRKSVKDEMQKNRGAFATRKLVEQLTDLVSDGFKSPGAGAFGKLAAIAGSATTYSALSWNVVSSGKQVVGFPAWSAVLDRGGNVLGDMARYILAFDRTAAQELMESDGFVARYGGTSLADMFREAFKDPSKNWIHRFYVAGMNVLQVGDIVASVVVGTGVYKAKKLDLMRGGMSEAEARQRAATETWALAEECQQSSRMENMNDWMRRQGFLARQLVKFASSPLLQLSHEVHAARMIRATQAEGRHEDAKKWRRRLVNQILCNHIVMPALMLAVEQVFGQFLLGNEPPEEEEWVGQLIMQCVAGPFGRVFLLGAFADGTGYAIARAAGYKPKMYDNSGMPTHQTIQKILRNIYRIQGDFADEDWESIRDDILQALSQAARPIGYGVRIWQNAADYDPSKERQARKREIRKQQREAG